MEFEDILQSYIVAELTAGTPVEPDDDLLADGTVDSMGVVQLLSFIEERFGYAVPVAEVTIENFGSVRTLARFLRSRVNGTG